MSVFFRNLVGKLMMLNPGHRKAVFLERKLDAIIAVLKSYLDYVNPEIAFLGTEPSAPIGTTRILLVGYYGGNNLGDELTLRTILKYAVGFANIKYTVMLAGNPDYDSSTLGDVDIIHYCRSTSDMSHLAAKYDALIVGGGALFDDVAYPMVTNHFKSLSFIVSELPKYFKARQKKVVYYGVSTNGQIKDANYARLLGNAVANADYFSVRDQYSLSVLKSCGNIGTVRLVDDIVLCDEDLIVKGDDQPDGKGGRSVTIGVTWICLAELKQLLLDILRKIVESFDVNIQIRLIPFANLNNADIAYYEVVLDSLSPDIAKMITVTAYDNGLAETIQKFKGCDVALTMRYHAALVCGAIGIPQVILELRNYTPYKNEMQWLDESFTNGSCRLDTDTSAGDICNQLYRQFRRGKVEPIPAERINANRRELGNAISIAYRSR